MTMLLTLTSQKRTKISKTEILAAMLGFCVVSDGIRKVKE